MKFKTDIVFNDITFYDVEITLEYKTISNKGNCICASYKMKDYDYAGKDIIIASDNLKLHICGVKTSLSEIDKMSDKKIKKLAISYIQEDIEYIKKKKIVADMNIRLQHRFNGSEVFN